MKLTKEDIAKIAKLARLSLTDEEAARYQEQLSSVLEYMDVLNEADTSKVEITSQVTGLEDVFREDVVDACKEDERDLIIGQFPESKDFGLKVPAVLE